MYWISGSPDLSATLFGKPFCSETSINISHVFVGFPESRGKQPLKFSE